MKAIIVDIDGTLADCSHRRHFVEQKPKDWKSFTRPDLVMQDKCNEAVKLVCNHTPLEVKNIIVSGRSDEHLSVTKEWLKENDVWFDEIHMRKAGDFREDWIVKEEILDRLLAEGYEILFTIDDRKQVVDMWRRRGLTCFQVAEGNF